MKLKKELGLLEVFCVSAGAMISSGLFILPALAYLKAGPSMMIAYIIASILILPTVLAKAELSTAMPKTGGIFFFTDRSMGPMMGTVGGLAAWFSLAFKSAFALLGMGIFMTILNPGFTEFQIKLIAVGFCIFFTIVNIYGVKLAAKFQVTIVLTLIVLLIFYIAIGMFHVRMSRFEPFAPGGIGPIFATAGMVFVSFAGTTKIAALAGEVKNPGRNLPLGMLLSWGVVSILYLLVIFITVGVVEPDKLGGSLTPINLGGDVILGGFGVILMSMAAMLAFISTGNSGILAASRDPMAMGKDELLPRKFASVSKHGTPWFAIIFTSGFMITIILMLDLESFIKTASTLKLILFILANLALIFMRESRVSHYRPKFRAPFYPWAQVFGIAGYGFLITQMGATPLIIVGIFILCGLGYYGIYSRGRIKREYALVHMFKRLVGMHSDDHMLNEELREILIERDNLTEERFERKLKDCEKIYLKYFVPPEEMAEIVSARLSGRLGIEKEELYKRMVHRERDSSILVRSGYAIISFHITGENKFDIALVFTRKGVHFSKEMPPVRVAFVVVSSLDEKSFYHHSLMWILQITDELNLEDFGIDRSPTALHKSLLKRWKNLRDS